MSTGTAKPKPQAVKDVIFLDPEDIVLNRKWNGRWNAIQEEAPPEDSKDLSGLNSEAMVSVRKLADSIKQYGQLQDILVYEDAPDDQGRAYHATAGQTRVRAIALLAKEDPSGNHKVRCRILPKNVIKDDKSAFLFNEEENRMRNNLRLLDKAYCMQRERDDLGMSAADIAKRWNCSVQAVAQALSLVDLPPEVQQAISDRLITATDAITSMKNLSAESMKEIVQIAREAQAKGTPLRSSQIKDMARDRMPVKPAETPTTGTTPANGAGVTAPPKPAKKGRPASPEKRVPRGLSDLRNVLKDREGAVSQALNRYLDGYVDMSDQSLINILNAFEYPDDVDSSQLAQVPITPRTEGGDQVETTPAGAKV
jgi:ParB/RepB/Spo0J family partition protein